MSFTRLFACCKKDNPTKIAPYRQPTALRFCAFPCLKLMDPTLNEVADRLKEIFNEKAGEENKIDDSSDVIIFQKDLFSSFQEMESVVEPSHPYYAYLELEIPLESTELSKVKVKIENIVSIRDSHFNIHYDDESNQITGKYLFALPPQEYEVYYFTP